ncbi:MAG: thioester reductase domain-containing protein [Litorimonas sp.]
MAAKFQRRTYPDASPAKRSILRLHDLAEVDPQIAAHRPLDAVKFALNDPDATLLDMVQSVLTNYGNREALGERSYDVITGSDGSSREYGTSFSTLTYSALERRIKCLANAWRHHPDHKVGVDEFICMIGFSGIDYVSLDLACIFSQTTGVPLQAELGANHLSDIFDNIEPSAVAVSIRDLPAVIPLVIKNGNISSLIVMDYDSEVTAERRVLDTAIEDLTGNITKIITIDDLIAYGSEFEYTPLKPNNRGVERRVSIVHSSGSTGVPKGAVMPERAIKMVWRGARSHVPAITIALAPFNHVIGRSSVINTLSRGGLVNFTLMPDMSTLFEDIRLTRPTTMAFFPRILELIYQNFQNEVTRRSRSSDRALDAIEAEVKAEMGAGFLGDRLLSGGVGGAPVAQPVLDFMRDCFDMLLVNIYGSTESGSGSITLDGRILRPPVTEYRLRDAPELGYYTTDKPNPRGELCFKSTGNITEYYKQPDATKGLFDEDGFQCTGDIVEELAPDYVVVIDRRKDVLKLSQGEFVAVGPLGTVFEGGSAVLKQVYLYGNSVRSYLLAVIVPDQKAVQTLLGDTPDEDAVRSLIQDELRRVGIVDDLKSFEIPRDFIVELDPFSQENGLLSSVRKRLRPALKRKYGAVLESIYEAAETRQKNEIAQLKDPSSTLTTEQKIGKVLEAQLGLNNIDVTSDRNFSQWGGDSLGAVLFGLSLEEIFGVEVPPNTVLSPTGSIGGWAKFIETVSSGVGQGGISFGSLHGDNPRELLASELRLSALIDLDCLELAKHLSVPPDAPSQVVLITGANGFLGRFICLDWLKKMSETGGKVVCIIRGKDDAHARERLNSVFLDGDQAFSSTFNALAQKCLQVVSGDLALPNFGLDKTQYFKLARSVDRVVHVAALVNHKLSYANLFDANVLGTAEIIKFALSKKLKPFDFVSTVAVQANLDMSEGNTENASLKTRIKLTSHYASGYGVSKWAGEVMLNEAAEQYSLPVNIFRGDMMLAHESFAGQMNSDDMFTRLLFSLIETGIAPRSFYQLDDTGGIKMGHYDGVPVNVVSSVVSHAPVLKSAKPTVFNIMNYHTGDGCSLDSFVAWMIEAGNSITYIDNHAEWFEKFVQKLKALPPETRGKSVLAIADAFSLPMPTDRPIPGHHNFRALYKDISGGKEIPNLSESFIRKCLADMTLKKLIR